MKWSHATGLFVTCTMIAAGAVWVGCSSNDNGNDAGTDGGGSDVTQQKDTGTTPDSGSKDSGGGDASDGGGIAVDASALDCNYYCATIMQVCNATSNKQYIDNATCLAMCANVPNDAGAGATSGDSLACRMYHLSVAAQSSALADTHCPHAGPYGFGMCGTLCNTFCEQDFATAGPCKGDNYPTADVCHTYCAGAAGADAAAGAPAISGASAMGCREYHLEAAYQSGTATPHCPHAGEDGGGVCP